MNSVCLSLSLLSPSRQSRLHNLGAGEPDLIVVVIAVAFAFAFTIALANSWLCLAVGLSVVKLLKELQCEVERAKK